MKSKIIYSVFVAIGIFIYTLSFIATKPNQPFYDNPCYMAIQNKINTDTSIGKYVYFEIIRNDTLLLMADTTKVGNWSRITDTICKVYKNNCPSSNNNKSVLVINWKDTATSTWDTRYGKKLLFSNCP